MIDTIKYYLGLFVCVFITHLNAQSVFNVLDSSSNGFTSITVTDSVYFAVGRAYNQLGESKIVLHKYSLTGQELYYDTLTDAGVTYNGRIGSSENDIILFNGFNAVPPYNPSTANLSLHHRSPVNLNSINQVEYNDSGEQIPSCLLVADSNFYLGSTEGYSGTLDFNLIKTDTAGNVKWNISYGNGIYSERLFSVCLTNDNNLLLAGDRELSGSDWNLVLYKIDLDGNIIWEKEYGQGLIDYNGASIFLNDHSIIVYHSLNTGSSTTGYIDKLDGNGDLIWSKPFPYNDYSPFDYASPFEDEDGTIVVCQTIKNASNKAEVRIMRLSPIGQVIWEKTYLTRPDLSQYINTIRPTADGGFIAGGSAYPVGINIQHTWLIKANCLGEEGVQYPVTGAPCDQYDCSLYSIDASFTASETYIDLATQSGIVTFENNSSNATSRVWNFGDGVTDYTDSIMTHTYGQVGTYEVELIVFHGMCSDTLTQTIEVVNTSGVMSPNLDYGVKVYPNPSNGDFTISFKNAPEGNFKIVDLAGRVHLKEVFNGALKYRIEDLQPGAYLIQIHYPSGVNRTERINIE